MGADALTGPYDEIPIPAQVKDVDYEGELCLVISKAGQEHSRGPGPQPRPRLHCRQRNLLPLLAACPPPQVRRGQFCFSKGFDKFAPLGPTLMHPSRFAAASGALAIETRVNCEREPARHYQRHGIWRGEDRGPLQHGGDVETGHRHHDGHAGRHCGQYSREALAEGRGRGRSHD